MHSLTHYIKHFRKIQKRFYLLKRFLAVLCILTTMAIGSALSSLLFPYEMIAPYLGSLVALVGSVCIWKLLPKSSKSSLWSYQDVVKHLECTYPNMKTSIWDELTREEHLPKALRSASMRFKGRSIPSDGWHALLFKEASTLNLWNVKKLFGQGVLLLMLSAILSAMIMSFPHIIYPSTKHALSWIPAFRYHNTLTIERGVVEEDKLIRVELSTSNPPTIQVSKSNLLRLEIHSMPAKTHLSAYLSKLTRDSDGKITGNSPVLHQSFRVQKHTTAKETFSLAQPFHTLKFHVDKDVALWIPEISEKLPVAHIILDDEPVPEVGLVALSYNNPEKSWYDEDPMPLKISAVSEYPLKHLKLIIQSGERSTEELVTDILRKDQKSLTYDYHLLFTPYMRRNQEHFHIVAQATAQRGEKLLHGYSDPLEVTVSSGYGRYQETLVKLSELRKELQKQAGNSNPTKFEAAKHATKVAMLMQAIQENASSTAFFDHYDRFFLEDLAASLDPKTRDTTDTSEVIGKLTVFLESHEALNDRQRDRDFFVAARVIGTLLEKPKYTTKLLESSEDMKSFLQDRQERWAVRIQKVLPSLRPKNADAIIGNGEFSFYNRWHYLSKDWPQMDTMKASQRDAVAIRSRELLQNMVVDYRHWIQALEAAEAATKSQVRRKHHKTLSEAENKLRALQKRQDSIAKSLDLSSAKQEAPSDKQTRQSAKAQSAKENLDWKDVATRQQEVLSECHSVLDNLAQVPNMSTRRLESATQSMLDVLGAGAKQDYITAEEQADRASRLLRAGAEATRRHRMNQQQRDAQMEERSRKRTVGNSYFGRGIADLDLEREHSVDPKYREDILEDARKQDSVSKKDKPILMRYLREMLR